MKHKIFEYDPLLKQYEADFDLRAYNFKRKKKELLTDCQMVVETIRAVTHCDGCGQDYATVAHGRICPHCGSEKTWLITGNEINIKEITVPES